MSCETLNNGWCERLYDAKAAHLILYGRALGLSHSEAEDVVQEAFVALLASEKTPECAEAYVYRTVRNRSLNYKRGLWRRIAREIESKRWFERASDESDLERAAMRCLALLPSEQREVIVLKIWSQHTFEEIARHLDLSPNTVAGRYRYGMVKLRASLKGMNYEPLEQSRRADAGLDASPALA